MTKKNKDLVARLDNQLVMKAHYNLSTNEQKLILFLTSRLDTEREDFNIQRVKIKEIEKFLSDGDEKRWGSIYERVDIMCSNITSKKITLPKGFVVNGEAIQMRRYIQWFTDIDPYLDEDGEISLKFQFASSLKDFLLQLKEYVRVNLVEVLPMRGKHAIRMYQAFKAERDRTKKYKEVSHFVIDLVELKGMLGIGDKYKALQDFKKRVLEPMQKEINEYSKEISIEYKYIKVKRRVTAIDFLIFDKDNVSKAKTKSQNFKDYVPTSDDIVKLTRAKLMAYKMLVKFGVKEGIAYREMIPKIVGGVVEGHEDVFVKHAITHFKKWAKQQQNQEVSAATFVIWWTKAKVFSHDKDVFWKINEKVHNTAKKYTDEVRKNREAAKYITNAEFESNYKVRQN